MEYMTASKFAKAWVAGWDASLTYTSCPYSRRDYIRAWDRGRKAGKRASIDDVGVLRRMLANA